MPVIALLGNKGGAGKTTLCVNMATAIASSSSIAVLDADPQQSSSQWFDISEMDYGLDVHDASKGIATVLNDLSESSDFVLIDCPPSVHSDQMQEALELADMALIPVQPSPLDIWATVHVEEAVETAKQKNPDLQAMMVINQYEPWTKLSKMMERAMAELTLPTAETMIHRRSVYRNSFLEGLTVHNMGSKGSDASAEIFRLIREIEVKI